MFLCLFLNITVHCDLSGENVLLEVSDNVETFSHLLLVSYTTYQDRGIGIRKISKENEDVSENNKTET